MKIYQLIKIIMIVVLFLAIESVTVDAAPWWDESRQFRLPITVGATGFDRVDKPVDISLNFTQVLSGLGKTGTLDENSIRIIETDSSGTILNSGVQFQFDKDLNFDATNRASGTIIFIMDGTTQASKSRYYYVYFGLKGGSYVPITITPLVSLTNNIIDENQSSYKISNINGTYYFQKQAGGFSSLNDISGNDWISFNNIDGTSGTYRGIPNAVYAEGIFYPGFTCCTSDIISQGPIKIKIRSTSNDGKWESIWDFYPRYAKMAITKVDHNYWMLYEGTPGGVLEPNIDFVVRSNGVETLLSQSWQGDIANNEWLYFSDPNIGSKGRSLFFAHHEDDTIHDEYRPYQNMTVFGFGRNGSTALLSSIPQYFTMGLLEGTNFSQNSKNIYSAYKNLTIIINNAEKYSNDNSDIRLTYNNSNDRQPAWSPDSQYIAFTSTRNGNWEIYKMSKEGEGFGISRLTNYSGFDLEPAWAPNSRILFSRGSFGYEDVYVMNEGGTGVKRLTNETDFDEYPDWSPDGTKIVYSSVGGITGGAKNLWIMNSDGTGKYKISDLNAIQPSWSPDGTKIAFKCYFNGNNICVMNSDGSGVQQLTFDNVNTHDPDWSPDSKRIVYASNKDGDWEIYVMNANGSNKTQLTSNVGIEDNYPAWSPDGQIIAYSSNRSGNDEIWLMNVGGENLPNLSIISWSPTNNNINTIVGSSQTFSITINKNADIVWYINNSIANIDENKKTSSYTNYTAGVGSYNVKVVAGNGIENVSKEWTWTVSPEPILEYIPPVPIITYTIGNFWINFTLNPGNDGNYNKTDGYNVSINGDYWINGTTNYFNNTVDPHGQTGIIALAYNSSGTGSLSEGYTTSNIEIPNNIPIQSIIGNKNVIVGDLLTFTVSAADADFDQIIYGTSATKGSFDETTGVYSWIPEESDVGTYTWYFNSSDNYGGVASETINVDIISDQQYAYIPPAPIDMICTQGNFWIDCLWYEGTGNKTDSYNVSINDEWTNETIEPHLNISVNPHDNKDIIIYAYNSSGIGNLSLEYAFQNVQMNNNVPTQSIIGDKSVTVGDLLTFTVSATDTDYTDEIIYGTSATKGPFDETTGVYSWIPEESDVGTYTWYFNSSDNYGGVASETINIIVSSAEIPLSIVSSSPLLDPTVEQGQIQDFAIVLNKIADIKWFIDNVQVQTDAGISASYTNSSIGVGIYNVSVTATNGTDLVSRSWNWKVRPKAVIDYIPPKPINLQNKTGNFWVNYTWQPGLGKNKTDLYNVSINNIVGKNIAETFINVTSGPHGLVGITAFAYNLSGTGSLSIENINGNIQIPNNPPSVIVGNKEITADNLLTFTVATDIDNDSLIYGTNATKGYINMTTGIYSWQTNSSDIGTYIWYFNSSDNYGGVANKTITVTVKQRTSNGGGNSGGGSSGGGVGGGGSNENYLNIDVKERKELYIYKDNTASYSSVNKRNPIIFINITGNTSAGEITVIVEALKDKSSLLKTKAPGVIYKNINIWVGTSGFVTSKNIKSSTILFRIENSWLDKNNFGHDDIKMVNWDGTNWITLDTAKKMSNDTYIYFETNVDKFSHFAIIGLKEEYDSKNVPIIKPRSNTQKSTRTRINQTDKGLGSAKSMPGFDISITMMVLLISYRMIDTMRRRMFKKLK